MEPNLWETLYTYVQFLHNLIDINQLLLGMSHHSKVQKDGWAKYNPNFGFK